MLDSLNSVGAVVSVKTPVGKPRSPLRRAGRDQFGAPDAWTSRSAPPVGQAGVGRVPDVAAGRQDGSAVDAGV